MHATYPHEQQQQQEQQQQLSLRAASVRVQHEALFLSRARANLQHMRQKRMGEVLARLLCSNVHADREQRMYA